MDKTRAVQMSRQEMLFLLKNICDEYLVAPKNKHVQAQEIIKHLEQEQQGE